MKKIIEIVLLVLVLTTFGMAECSMQGYDARSQCLQKVKIALDKEAIKELKLQTEYLKKILKELKEDNG